MKTTTLRNTLFLRANSLIVQQLLMEKSDLMGEPFVTLSKKEQDAADEAAAS